MCKMLLKMCVNLLKLKQAAGGNVAFSGQNSRHACHDGVMISMVNNKILFIRTK